MVPLELPEFVKVSFGMLKFTLNASSSPPVSVQLPPRKPLGQTDTQKTVPGLARVRDEQTLQSLKSERPPVLQTSHPL